MSIADRLSKLSNKRLMVAIVSFIATAAAFGIALGLHVNADFITLLNPNDPAVASFRLVGQKFHNTDVYILLCQKNDPERLKPLAEELKRLPDVLDVGILPSYSMEAGATSPQETLVLVRPVFSPTDLAKSERLSGQIKEVLRKHNIPAGISGSYQVLVEAAQSINRDMQKSSVITFAAIIIYLFVFLRLPMSVVMATAWVLLCGLSLSLAITRLTLHELNYLTATLPAGIMGLGIDFSLHIIYAFNEQAKHALTGPESDGHRANSAMIAAIYRKLLMPLSAGAATTITAFLALCFIKSRGLVEMGIVVSIGIGCSFLTSVLFLPAILSAVRLQTLARIRRSETLLPRILGLISNKKPVLALLLLAILGGSAYYSGRIQFCSDQNSLIDTHLPSYAIQEKILNQYHLSPVPVLFLSPDLETEKQKLTTLLTNSNGLFGFAQSPTLAPLQHLDPSLFKASDGSVLTLAYPVRNPFEPEVFDKIRRFCDQIDRQYDKPGNHITGSPFLNDALSRAIRGDLILSSLLASVFVVLTIALFFQAIRNTLLSLIPVVFGVLLTAGIMGVWRLDISLMTIVIVPLIIGVGIDNGVHMLFRWHREERNAVLAATAVANPMIATSATSMIAYASLMASTNPGFRQLGLVALIGLGACLFFTLIVMPSVLSFFEGRHDHTN